MQPRPGKPLSTEATALHLLSPTCPTSLRSEPDLPACTPPHCNASRYPCTSTAARCPPAADDTLARKVGLHIRGRASFRENNTDESDPARHMYHTQLKKAATTGESESAEQIIANMEAAGLAPGPRAYHAFVFAHVKGGSPSGALAAIRRCWESGVVPLPETYAAVVAAHLGARDLDTAEAVLASNRRAGVDCTRSWQLLVGGLFKMGQGAKALEVYEQVRWGGACGEGICDARQQRWEALAAAAAAAGQRGLLCCAVIDPVVAGQTLCQTFGAAPTPLLHHTPWLQGEAEGLQPDAALYQALIQYMCSQGNAADAATVLQQMQVSQLGRQVKDPLGILSMHGTNSPARSAAVAADSWAGSEWSRTLDANHSCVCSTGGAAG